MLAWMKRRVGSLLALALVAAIYSGALLIARLAGRPRNHANRPIRPLVNNSLTTPMRHRPRPASAHCPSHFAGCCAECVKYCRARVALPRTSAAAFTPP